MDVQRIHDGLWRWAVVRDGLELASAYVEHGDCMLLIDPVLPPPGDDLQRFERAIARDLARLPGRRWVIVTREDDPRDAEALVEMTQARQWRPGDEAPEGMATLGLADGTVAAWSQRHAALMPGPALQVRDGQPEWAMAGSDAARLRALAPGIIIPSVGPMWRATG